jgi:hypothetical protein
VITDSGLPSLGMATFPQGAIKASQISISNIFLNSLDGFAAGATACVGINNNPHLTSANSHCSQCVKFDYLSCERPIDCVFVLKLDLGGEYYGLGLLSARGNKIAIFRRWTAKAVLFNAPSRSWTLPWNWGEGDKFICPRTFDTLD